MKLLELAVRQPVTVAVGVLLSLLAGFVALQGLPVRMTPEVDSVVIAVSTSWENASPEEIESDVVEPQEQVLGTLSGLVSMTSTSQAGQSLVRLEFETGTDIKTALAEVDQKLGEVPSYPAGVDEPRIDDLDPESIDYIAWIGLASTDPAFDSTTLYDFMERRLKPRYERIPGVSEVGIRGAREREVHIRVDPVALAQRGITWAALVDAIRLSNEDFSGGKLPDGKNDVRVRAVGRFSDVESARSMVVRRDAAGPVYLGDVAEVVATHKEVRDWVRGRGQKMPFFNFQLETGGNLLDTMAQIRAVTAALNAPGGVLEQEAQKLGLNGKLELVQTYDSTTYVVDALALVKSNVWIGGILATLTLLFFLRSLRSIGIIAVAIPISVIGTVTILAALGRTLNIISLAGIAFATGMVVDNAIVVLENVFRHLELGKNARQAALDGAREVAGAVVASTLTTLVVFVPILLIQEAAGQLFRDIALAIMAAVGVSLVVALSVVPSLSARVLKAPAKAAQPAPAAPARPARGLRARWNALVRGARRLADVPGHAAALVLWLTATWTRRVALIGAFAIGTTLGIAWLVPPLDYLPQGNRNIVFGVLIPPPGYTTDQMSALGERIEARIRPYWEAAGDRFGIEPIARGNAPLPPDARQPVADAAAPGGTIVPPSLDHYFLVSFDGMLFHLAISEDKQKAVDALALFQHATAGDVAPDVFSFAFQFPLFRTGGTTGSAIKVDLVGDDLDTVTGSGGALFVALMERFGPYAVTPDPANFLLPTPELRVTPDDERLRDLGMSRRDVGLAVQASGDGIFLPRQFELGDQLEDIKILTHGALENAPLLALAAAPIATPGGQVVDLASLAKVERVVVPDRIRRVDRQRAVTLQVTPPPGMPLADAIAAIEETAQNLRTAGAIAPGVEVALAGSAGRLAEIKTALLGDGTLAGTLTSSLALAFLVVYLLMVVLFQSWTHPLVIMVSVPLATLGGFAALAAVHAWSAADRYVPVQNLDVLTILGFVILAGVVVNNAILIVHQALNFMNADGLAPRAAIAESVRTRVRPILMSTLTSVGGMLPLVLMPGAGSELYRGLGAVVVGGLAVSTVFTLVLVPVLLEVVLRAPSARRAESRAQEMELVLS